MRKISSWEKIVFLLFCIVFTATAGPSFAQRKGYDNLLYFDDKPVHFGFYLGLNTMDYRMSHYPDVYQNPLFLNPDNVALREIAERENYFERNNYRAEVHPPAPGFSVGGVANLRLGRDFDLRFTPGMTLGSRHLIYSIKINQNVITESGAGDESSYLTTPSAYVDLPLGIRYKGFRHYNLRPYIYLGGAFRRDLENKRISESVIHLRRNSFYAEVSLGLDSYLEYFRFTGELKFSYGLNNIVRHDTDLSKPVPYYGYIFKEINSNILTLIFYFE